MTGATQIVQEWVALYNDGTPGSYGSDRFLSLYAEDVDWQELPNAFRPHGRTGNLADLREALAAGQAAFRDRHVVLAEIIADPADAKAAFRYVWRARFAADTPIGKAGGTLALAVAQFIEVRDGRIIRSMEYAVPAA